jgi:3-methyl-2-oxobutanoate hydroxymethyltransferase
MTPEDFISRKKTGPKITMLTAYDYPFAALLDSCGIDIILVGDSVANVVLGLESTREVSIEDMLYHAKAVRRGVKEALLVGDLPYSSLQIDPKRAVVDAKRFVAESGCEAVKVEWFDGALEVTKKIIAEGIPVMGHVGLTPQTAEELGGFKVQGKTAQAAERIIEQARKFEEAGCFSLVLECVPDRVAGIITAELKIPTIGIGAGPYCDGQVLVTHDILGLYDRLNPKFVRRYVEAGELIKKGVREFRREVTDGTFPEKANSFSINDSEWDKLKG